MLPILLVLGSKLKFLAVIAKFGLPMLKTGGTMMISAAFYAWQFGWPWAIGFVLCILVHEMGHVFVAWRVGVPVSAPYFIPFAGAVILQKRAAKSVWDEALIGIGGPLGGTLASLICLGIYSGTGDPLFLSLAHVGFMLNLFNLAPLFPLDGGWITAAVSPRLWLVGIVLLGLMVVTGRLRNPMLLILLFMSLPRLIHGLRTGDATPPGGQPATMAQKWIMGSAYLLLCGCLAWLMAVTVMIHPSAD